MGQGKIILWATFTLLLGLALGSISGIEIDAEGFAFNWRSLSSIMTALAGIATAIAAWTAVKVYRYQRAQVELNAAESSSKFYLDECLQTIRNACQILRDGERSHESFISAGLLFGEISQLEHNIVNAEHRRLYRLHRQYEIDQTEYVFGALTIKELRGPVFKYTAENDKLILVNIEYNNTSAPLKNTVFYTEELLDNQVLVTPFPGVPLGRLLCIYRFFINDPHYTRPGDRLTNRELHELKHLKPISVIKQYIESCLLFDVQDNAVVLRKEPVALEDLNMGYNMGITRNYVN